MAAGAAEGLTNARALAGVASRRVGPKAGALARSTVVALDMMPSKETRDPPSLYPGEKYKAPAIPRLYLKSILGKGKMAACPLESPDGCAYHREERSDAAISKIGDKIGDTHRIKKFGVCHRFSNFSTSSARR